MLCCSIWIGCAGHGRATPSRAAKVSPLSTTCEERLPRCGTLTKSLSVPELLLLLRERQGTARATVHGYLSRRETTGTSSLRLQASGDANSAHLDLTSPCQHESNLATRLRFENGSLARRRCEREQPASCRLSLHNQEIALTGSFEGGVLTTGMVCSLSED